MADTTIRQNPFDYIHGYLDNNASFDDNAANVYALFMESKLDLHVVAELLVEAATMPILARENMQLCGALKDMSSRLDAANETIRKYSECPDDSDKPPHGSGSCRFLAFPKGTVVN